MWINAVAGLLIFANCCIDILHKKASYNRMTKRMTSLSSIKTSDSVRYKLLIFFIYHTTGYATFSKKNYRFTLQTIGKGATIVALLLAEHCLPIFDESTHYF